MKLSLTEAARHRGKTTRQPRYLLKTGKLPATKESGRWQIDSNDLPQGDGKAKARKPKLERAADIAEKVLRQEPKRRKTYSLQDLKAFQTGKAIFHELLQAKEKDHPACEYLREALLLLGCGCRCARHGSPIARANGGGPRWPPSSCARTSTCSGSHGRCWPGSTATATTANSASATPNRA